jgi:hypothetical protein
LLLGTDYHFTQCEDVFQNYEDYQRHSGRAYVCFRQGRFAACTTITARAYDHPNAFAFDNSAAAE